MSNNVLKLLWLSEVWLEQISNLLLTVFLSAKHNIMLKQYNIEILSLV